MLLIGVGQEELARVLFLSRLWRLTPAIGWHWVAVVLSAVVFDLAHLYQGPAGMVSTGISESIMATYYLAFGRIWPMAFAHYLHDALQFVFVVLVAVRERVSLGALVCHLDRGACLHTRRPLAAAPRAAAGQDGRSGSAADAAQQSPREPEHQPVSPFE